MPATSAQLSPRAPAPASAPRSTGLLRRHRDFRLLWGGEVAGKFGAAVTGVAMPLVAVSTMDAGAFAVSLLGAAAWLPWLIIGLPAGAWVDRLPRRPVMLASVAVSLVLFLGVPLAHWTGRLTFGLLLAVALLAGVAAVFFQTAYTVFLPALLEPGDLQEGNAALHGSASAAMIAGQGGGGLLVQLVGAVGGLLTNAVTFAVSLGCLLAIRHREPPLAKERRPAGALLREMRQGLRLVARDPWFRTLSLYGAASNLALMGYQSLLVIFLVKDVQLASGAVGGLIAVANAGGVAGAFMSRRIATRIGTARAVLLFALGPSALALLIPLSSPGAGVLFFAVGGFCVSAAVVAVNVVVAGFRQRYCPPELLGRVSASSSFLNYGTLPLGALLGGALGSALGARPALWILTAAVPLAGLLLLGSPVRGRRDLPARPSEGGRAG
ncbi:MFS transporter [Streptomyces sp. 35G-GA-8]|uniref:MFS transporter n=1 Tax=Streptomyces sp. 35G-GA-8 TaxID=2939434 RepID=UPI00201EB2A8|nr:MFS transporter [Streptomyces sp. 35G-GA-8]MCL7378531.1 MFS transporter [Streptomyces sp. 35G-GA-8]